MADYQSLLSRAVANLPSSSSAATRQAIYDRARKALLTQLRALRPPLPESDIAREESALDAAIAQVEAQFVPPDAFPESPTPAPPVHASPGPSARTPAASRPTVSPQAALKSAPPNPAAQPAPQPSASPVGPAQGRSTAPPAPSGPAAKPPTAAPTQSDPAASAPARSPIQPPQSQPGAAASAGLANPSSARVAQGAPRLTPLQSPAAAQPPPTDRPKAAAKPTVRESFSRAPANLANVVPAAKAEVTVAAGAPPVVASRAEDAIELAGAPEVPSNFERVASTARADSEGQRPIVPGGGDVRKPRSWPWLALAAVVGVVVSVAITAIVMRQRPQDLAINPPAEPRDVPAPQASAKIAERVQLTPANPGAPLAASSEQQVDRSAAQSATPSGPGAEPQTSAAATPVAARAAMLIASPDNPQKPVVNLGSTVWSTIAPSPGQPATVAVKADADVPDLKMHASMTLRKNADPTLQATHTIDLKFSFADGAPITGFKDVGLPQMRKLDSTASETLTSVKVKISDDYFLIALASGEQDIVRNLDLMQTRVWFDFPLLLNDNRIAKMVFQKSPEGEAMLAKAFEAWK